MAEACRTAGGTRSDVLLAALELYLRAQRTEVMVPTAAVPVAGAPTSPRRSSRRTEVKDDPKLL